MKKMIFGTLIFFSTFSLSAQSSPSEAVTAARKQLEAKQFREAIATLQAAVPAAADFRDPAEKSAALASIHFYSAVAFDAIGEEAKTREELVEFFRFKPEAGEIDARLYSPRFVATYRAVRPAAQAVVGNENMFDRIYPGYRIIYDLAPETPQSIERWGALPPLQILGTKDEVAKWGRSRTEEDRREFIRNFWARRDPTPDTPENEYRIEFESRVAFADRTFGTERTRGSLTDRGRVFALLGRPRSAKVGPLRQINGQIATHGLIERWLYSYKQVPKGAPRRDTEFVFITQDGYGEGVLQKDFFPMKVLDAAKKD